MEILPPYADSLQRAASLIATGSTVIHATETCYGIACDLTNPQAVQHLFDVKHRRHDQPVSALFASVEEAKSYVEWNDVADDLAKTYLPGPLTIILRVRSDAPSPLFPTPSTDGQTRHATIGVRVSVHPVAMELARLCKRPISTTSANLSTLPSPYSLDDIRHQFAASTPLPDLVIDSGVLPSAPASTVVDCSDGQVRVVRQGEIRIEG